MEHKIGEIFEYNGEWYQCVEGNDCANCVFIDYCKSHSKEERDSAIGLCVSFDRNDGMHVIFEKLEKVGEPYEFEVPIFTENYATVRELGNNSKISIEIKQNKEDMEEKKLNLKPFDIQKAREGKPVCTRDGRKARIICFDRRLFYKNVSYPILALVECSDGEDDVCGYNEKGKVLIEDGAEYKDDLMMLPEKKEGWINVYKERIYSTKEEAIEATYDCVTYIDTIKISWEE